MVPLGHIISGSRGVSGLRSSDTLTWATQLELIRPQPRATPSIEVSPSPLLAHDHCPTPPSPPPPLQEFRPGSAVVSLSPELYRSAVLCGYQVQLAQLPRSRPR